MITYSFVGIDIAKDKFDVCLNIDKKLIEDVFENNLNGYKKFLTWLKKYTGNAFVCLEATGCYGDGIAEFLFENNIAVSVVNPMQIKNHARSLLTRNKNDKVDAKIIASYAEKFLPGRFTPKTEDQKQIKETAQLIDTLGEQKRQLQNQLESIRTKVIEKEINKTIKLVEQRITDLEKMLTTHVENDPARSEDKKRILTVKGIGEKSANRLIAYLPDISKFKNAKQLAAFVGISPKQHQSGKYNGKTKISKYGDARLRKALYMPALVAKNKNQDLKKFCDRLEKNGLKPKQIICAVMRKLIHIIFGILKHKQDFNPALV